MSEQYSDAVFVCVQAAISYIDGEMPDSDRVEISNSVRLSCKEFCAPVSPASLVEGVFMFKIAWHVHQCESMYNFVVMTGSALFGTGSDQNSCASLAFSVLALIVDGEANFGEMR